MSSDVVLQFFYQIGFKFYRREIYSYESSPKQVIQYLNERGISMMNHKSE